MQKITITRSTYDALVRSSNGAMTTRTSTFNLDNTVTFNVSDDTFDRLLPDHEHSLRCLLGLNVN